jgi:outer membrane protein TolC
MIFVLAFHRKEDSLRNMPRIFAAAFTLLLAVHSYGGETVVRPDVLHLRLDSAVRMAIAKNFSIEVQRFDPQIARARVTSELGRFDPVFDISATRSENTRRDAFINGEHGRINEVSRNDRLSTGLSGLTPWGLRYDAALGISNSTGSFNRFDESFGANAGIALTQPLLRGFGFSANLAQVRIARNNVLVSEWELRRRIIDVITTVNFVYHDLHLAIENLRVAEKSRDLARQLLADNMRRAEIGVMSPLNITTARAEAAARQEGVILALREVKDNENFLKQLVTMDMERMLSVRVEIEPPPFEQFKANVPAGIADALALRPDYQQALLDLKRRDIQLAFTKNQALPRFDLTGSLNLLGFDNDIATAVSRTGRRDETQWTAGAIFSVPLPNREGRGNVLAARLSSAQALVILDRLEQQIVVDVDNASGQIVTGTERIASTAESRKLAQESLDAGEERLRAGTGTTFEVLELQNKLAEAEAAELRAHADYHKAIGEYRRQTGTTLRVHNVVIE